MYILEKLLWQSRVHKTLPAFLQSNHKTGASNSAGMDMSLYGGAFEIHFLEIKFSTTKLLLDHLDVFLPARWTSVTNPRLLYPVLHFYLAAAGKTLLHFKISGFGPGIFTNLNIYFTALPDSKSMPEHWC